MASHDDVRAAYVAEVLAGLQDDPKPAVRWADSVRAANGAIPTRLLMCTSPPGEGFVALQRNELDRAEIGLAEAAAGAEALTGSRGLTVQCEVPLLLGWINRARGASIVRWPTTRRSSRFAEATKDCIQRSYVVWAIGVDRWQRGDGKRAVAVLERVLRQARETGGCSWSRSVSARSRGLSRMLPSFVTRRT